MKLSFPTALACVLGGGCALLHTPPTLWVFSFVEKAPWGDVQLKSGFGVLIVRNTQGERRSNHAKSELSLPCHLIALT